MSQIKDRWQIISIQRLLNAFLYSICGLKTVYEDNISFRQEVFLSILIIPLGLILGSGGVEKILLVGSWFLVVLIEVINSCLEAVVDRISDEIHPLSKKIKDMGSAAVLIAIANLIVVWGVILLGI